MTIRNPIEWSADSMRHVALVAKSATEYPKEALDESRLEVRHLELSDLRSVLAKGWDDFVANRSDVIFLCVIYPLAGLVATRLTINYNFLPLLFPLVSGFALIGPFAAAGLYEMSRRRERGETVSWTDAFGVFQSPSFAAIIKLALLMTGIFVLWLVAAMAVYHLTFDQAVPTSIASFAQDVFTTPAGWALILVGGGVGFVFALVTLAISVVSFPLLLDQPVGVGTAIRTSIRAVRANPVPMLAWGLIVAVSLAIGAVPALLGLMVVMPVLGHATWHLYRRTVAIR